MDDQGIHGRWYQIADRLFNRGLIGDILSTPGNIISQVLSPPAATTEVTAQAESTKAAATTQAAAATTPAATTKAAAAPAATTAAQQPAATPASSPKQEQQQSTPAPAAQAPATTSKQQNQQQSSTVAATSLPANATPALAVGAATTSSAAASVPVAAENAMSSPLPSQSAISQKSGVGIGGTGSTQSGVASSTQRPQAPSQENTSDSNNQTPLLATGAVLGIVVIMGVSLLFFWFFRRRRRACRHHEVIPSESPANDQFNPDARPQDQFGHNAAQMAENRAITSQDDVLVQHPQPQHYPYGQQRQRDDQDEAIPQANPFPGQPFTYAQAQQYVQSLAGTFGPPIPPIPSEPSPIRIFRWPTRSTRTGSPAPTTLSGLRSPNAPSRALSRASRSTMSSILWHGRRDVIARRTITQTPVSQRSNFVATSSTENTMPESLHTPVLDWLNWMRGHQPVEPDPEMNHRKSFASSFNSSEGSGATTASSGVFSPTLLSWPPPGGTPFNEAEFFQAIPLTLRTNKDRNIEPIAELSGSHVPNF